VFKREKTKRGGIKSFSKKISGSPKDFPKEISDERELKRGLKGFEGVEGGVWVGRWFLEKISHL